MILPDKDMKFLNKLLLLHNNLVQYNVIPYDEVLIEFEHILTGSKVIPTTPTTEMLVYYMPKSSYISEKKAPKDAHIIFKILSKYIETGIIKKEDMELANTIWKDIQKEAHNGN